MIKLSMTSFILVVIMTLNGAYVLADSERYCNLERKYEGPHPHGVCGDNLDMQLRMLCPLVGKRWRKRSKDTGGVDSYTKNSFRNKPVLLDKVKALSFLDKRNGFGRQGITCECCYHRCSIGELTQYCQF